MLVFVRFQCQHESRGRSSYSFRRQQICFPWYIPPQSSSHQQTCFSSWSAFFLVFKNLKGSFIFQQSPVFDWVPVRQSLYFFFSWMDSRFILSPSNFVVQSLKRVQTEPIPERCSPHKPVLRHTSGGRRCVFIEGRKTFSEAYLKSNVWKPGPVSEVCCSLFNNNQIKQNFLQIVRK